jgi:hypothetical protein
VLIDGKYTTGRRLTVSGADIAACDQGIFSPDVRLELIDGKIIETSPISSPHATVLRELTALFSRAEVTPANSTESE